LISNLRLLKTSTLLLLLVVPARGTPYGYDSTALAWKTKRRIRGGLTRAAFKLGIADRGQMKPYCGHIDLSETANELLFHIKSA
jgi:hypothetical protein